MKAFWRMFKRDWRNPANLVTLTRLALALSLPYYILGNEKRRRQPAVVFTLAAATDKLDGLLAKRVFGTTETGKILDPTVDKALAAGALIPSFVRAMKKGNKFMALVIGVMLVFLIVREWSVLRLKMRAQQATGTVESAIQSGRVSMVVQSFAYGALLVPTKSRRFDALKAALLAIAAGFSAHAWREYLQRDRKRT